MLGILEGYHKFYAVIPSSCGRCSVLLRIFIIVVDMMSSECCEGHHSVMEDTINTMEGYNQYCGGIQSVLCRNTIQLWRMLKQGYHQFFRARIPQALCRWYPKCLLYPTTVLDMQVRPMEILQPVRAPRRKLQTYVICGWNLSVAKTNKYFRSAWTKERLRACLNTKTRTIKTYKSCIRFDSWESATPARNTSLNRLKRNEGWPIALIPLSSSAWWR